VFATRRRTAIARSAVALAMALLLALRLLSPAGFMPEFVDGAVTIVACPDAGPVAAMAGHDHQQSKAKLHQTCPYAAAAGLGGLVNEPAPLIALLVVGLAHSGYIDLRH